LKKKDYFWKLGYLVITGGVFMIDLVTKAWAASRLRTQGDMPVIEGFLNFAYAYNTGVAFSMLDDHGDLGRWALSAVAVFGALLVLYFFLRTPLSDRRTLSGLAFLLAGILGNVTGRLQYGFVVDFIDVQFGAWHYPTFNVADISIWIGAGLLILEMIYSKKEKTEDSSQKAVVSS
jgi:signal peptidase II